MDAHDYATACPMLEQVTKQRPDSLGAKLELGICYESQAKLASAYAQYVLVRRGAAAAGQRDRADKALAREKAVEPRLAMITLVLPPEVLSTAGLRVAVDGQAVEPLQATSRLPVDPGAHAIAATAPGRKSWTADVEIKENGKRLSVEVRPLEVEGAAPGAPLAAERPAGGAPPSGSGRRSWQRPAAITAIGLGAAGLVAGTVLGGLALVRNDESNRDNHCDAQDTCDPVGLPLRREARALAHGSTAAFIAGGCFAAGGLVLLWTAPVPAPRSSAAGPTIAVGPRWGGVEIRGAW
jgi:hypothetical protein